MVAILFFCVPKKTSKNSTCCFAYLAIKGVKYYPFIIFKSMKTKHFHDKNSFLYVSAARLEN